MKNKSFILHHHKISEVPAQEDTSRTRKHWGYPAVNILYLTVVGFLQNLHKFFFHFHRQKNCSLNTTFSALRILRLCLALLLAGSSQTLLYCGWEAVLPGAIPASAARGCIKPCRSSAGCFPLSKIDQKCWSVLSYLHRRDTGPGSPRAQDSSYFFLFHCMIMSFGFATYCVCYGVFCLFITILQRSVHSYKS